MKKFYITLIILSSLFILLSSCGMMIGQALSQGTGQIPQEPYMGLVKISGALMDPTEVLKQMREHTQNKNCRGIMLRVDSPGGAVGAAQEINAMLLSLRKEDFPVVASFGNVSASGGVYATASASHIFANPGTVTGSIGVITQFPNAQKLLEKVGIEMNVLKSGKHKAMGNPFTSLSPESQQKMQAVIDDTWLQFVEAVALGRGLEVDSVKTFADGSIFTGRQAQKLGLVDSLGGMEAARNWLSDQVGLPKNSDLIEFIPPEPLMEQLFKGPLNQMMSQFQSQSPQTPMFLWK